jgi:hypothetical protein
VLRKVNVYPEIEVLGLCHNIQDHELSLDSGIRRDQERLKGLIQYTIDARGVDLVAEETKQGHRSIAEELAACVGCHYVDLDVPTAVQDCIHRSQPDDSGMRDEYCCAWLLVREWHMFQEFLLALDGHRSALLICGGLHVAGFRRELEHLGYKPVCVCFLLTALTETKECCAHWEHLSKGKERTAFPSLLRVWRDGTEWPLDSWLPKRCR